jgi:predicted Zn-dependent protease
LRLDLPKLRKLVALDPSDPLSRFALGRRLFEEHAAGGPPDPLVEAAEHLEFANERNPEHLTTYHVLGQVLAALGRRNDARRVFEAGIQRTDAVGEGMGRDLGPAMRKLLDEPGV